MPADFTNSPIIVRFTMQLVTGENPGINAPLSRISLNCVPTMTIT